mgnify:CR=1 FL=1
MPQRRGKKVFMPFSRIMTPGSRRGPGIVFCTAALLLAGSLARPLTKAGAAGAAPAPPASTTAAPSAKVPPKSPPAGVAKPAAKPPVKPAAKPPAKVPATPATPATTAKASCQGSEGQVSLLPAEGDIKCNEEFEDCEGKIELAATNCTGEFQSFYKLELFEGGRRTQILEFDPAGLASPGGGRWKESVPWQRPIW